MEIASAIIKNANQSAVDCFIQRYQKSTKDAVEGILCMGEAVFEVHTKHKSKELSESDLEYFCKSVHLDSKGSTFRKYKAIGQNADRMRKYMDKLPSTFSVIYEMATLSGDDFERFVIQYRLSKQTTLEEFKRMVNKSTALTKNKLLNPPTIKFSSYAIAKVINKINQFSISIMRDLPQSRFDQIVETLTEYRNQGWIQFDDPEIKDFINEEVSRVDEESLMAA